MVADGEAEGNGETDAEGDAARFSDTDGAGANNADAEGERDSTMSNLQHSLQQPR